MVRLADIPAAAREHIASLACTAFENAPWVDGGAVLERRVAIVSTAGLQVRGDRPFATGARDYRVIPTATATNDIVMSHISTNFDRSAFQLDLNVVFPIDRLHELAAAGQVGSVAAFHYSFMGATDPVLWEETARYIAGLLKQDRVDAALLVPV
jgi:D-proline reductase (dithiol) PrdB